MESNPLTREAETYLRRLASCLAELDADEKGEILAELRAHFAERMAQGRANPLEGFDPPEAYAARFVQEVALSRAVAGGRSIELGRALLASAVTGAETLFVVLPLLALQFFGATLAALGLLKPFFFHNIGVFLGDRPFVGYASDTHGREDSLGWWTVPLFVVVGVALLWACNLAMRAVARRRLARARRVGTGG